MKPKVDCMGHETLGIVVGPAPSTPKPDLMKQCFVERVCESNPIEVRVGVHREEELERTAALKQDAAFFLGESLVR